MGQGISTSCTRKGCEHHLPSESQHCGHEAVCKYRSTKQPDPTEEGFEELRAAFEPYMRNFRNLTYSRAYSALVRLGVHTLEEIASHTEEDLRTMSRMLSQGPIIGSGAIDAIEDVLRRHGLALQNDTESETVSWKAKPECCGSGNGGGSGGAADGPCRGLGDGAY